MIHKKIDASGERALKTALDSHDPDLIYLSLLHIHAKTNAEGYEEILKKYPEAARQYAIYCRQNGKIGSNLHKPKDDDSLATAAKTFKTAGANFTQKEWSGEQHTGCNLTTTQ